MAATAAERIATALEQIAARLAESDRAVQLEDALEDFVTLMQNPRASDAEWIDLLGEVTSLLGMDPA